MTGTYTAPTVKCAVHTLTPGQTILFRGAPLTITHIHHRNGSLASFFVLSCREGERVVKLSVREDSKVDLLP